MHASALILEMCPSLFVCVVIASYTSLKTNPEKLQRVYQDTTEFRCWKMSDLCFLCLTLFYVSNLNSAHNSTGWCKYFLC